MLDRLLAIISLSLITAFCVLLVSYIGRIDLAIVVAICLLMAAFDLLYYSFKNDRPGGQSGPR
jgi:hypothetical protein